MQRRAGIAHFAVAQRLRFFLLLFTAGVGEHVVDSVRYPIGPHAMLLVKPGQVQQFRLNPTLAGQLIVIEPSFFLPDPLTSKEVPMHGWWQTLPLLPEDLVQEFLTAAADLAADGARYAGHRLCDALLRHRLYTLLLQIRLFTDQAPAAASRTHELVHEFRRLVEAGYADRHSVTGYAARLGCSQKTLTRACWAVEDRSAKAVLDARLLLEAKRLLAHGGSSVSETAQQLGFSEATNFSRFFKSAEGLTPAAFRAKQPVSEAPP